MHRAALRRDRRGRRASPERLAALAEVSRTCRRVGDLLDGDAVSALAARVREDQGQVDGLIHLVGGWRGGDTFTPTRGDWRFLSAGLIDTLRHVTLAFHDDLITAPAGRVAIVSARAAARPSAGSANYAAAKAAAEAWMLALADSFAPRPSPRSRTAASAAVIFVIKALVDASRCAPRPAERKFPGFTDVADLADRIVELWAADAPELNGARIDPWTPDLATKEL